MRRAPWRWLLLVLLAAAPVVGAAEPITLRVTTQFPGSNPLLGRSMVQFKEEVEKEAAKALRIEIFDRGSGKHYVDDKVVAAVQSGAIEMGLAGINQITRRVPAADILQQPFLFNFEALMRAATGPESELRRLIDTAVLETIGVRVLWWQTAGPQIFLSKGLDLSDPARIRDKKVRVFSETMASFTRLCGGRPQILSIAKVRDALEGGIIDVVMTSAIAVETRKLQGVVDTITRTDHAGIEFLLIINEKTWQGLSDRHKAVILKAARKAELDIRDKASRLEAKAYDFVRNKGMTVHELAPSQVAEWRACSAAVLEGYMSGGGELERRLLRAYGKLRTDPCCNSGPPGAGSRR